MSNLAPEKTATQGTEASGAASSEYYPPPPGPPPNSRPAQHSNEQPIPDYTIPTYNPSDPSFAPPPSSAQHNPAFGGTKVHDDQSGHYGSSGGTKPALADRLSALGVMASSPINMLANKMGSEGFLPASLDKECEKAARILRGFCKDGIYADIDRTQTQAPSDHDQTTVRGKQQRQQQPTRAIITIPAKVLQRAVGLAVFTTGRVGFHVSGATGSGVLIARQADGGWSPPSGIQIHSLGAGFVFGADIYDCVLVINTEEALSAFRSTRLSLGTDLAVVAGPWGAGGSVDIAAPMSGGRRSQDRPGSAGSSGGSGHSGRGSGTTSGTGTGTGTGTGGTAGAGGLQQPPTSTQDAYYSSRPGSSSSSRQGSKKTSKLHSAASHAVYSYIKSRGVYAGVQVDGTVIVERHQANAAFYGVRVSASQILQGKVPAGSWVKSARVLMDAIRGAEGRAPAVQRPPQAQAQWQGQGQAQQQPAKQSPPQTYAKMSTHTNDTETWANAAPATTIVMPSTRQLPTGYSVEGENDDAHTAHDPHDLPPAYEEPGHAYPGVGDSKTTMW